MKVLILGAGGAASNGFARALKLAGGYELVGTNCSETDLLLSECDSNHLISSVSDYCQWRVDLFRVVKKTKPDFVHAQNDAEVDALGRFRATVHVHGAKTFLPSSEVVSLCRDKLASYERWQAAGIRVPLTYLASGRGDLAAVHERFREVWLRPKTGAGGQKSLRTKNFQLAREWLNHHDGWGEFTVAEPLTANTVTVQQLYWRGQLVCSQQRTRASWANSGSSATGVSGSTGVGVTSSDAEADRIADAAVAAVDRDPHGLYGIDMCRAEDGTPCPTEINIGRFFTTAPEFFASAGFNMADLYVSEAENAYFMRDQGFTEVKPTPRERNPLPDGYAWIRGMDRPPVLVLG